MSDKVISLASRRPALNTTDALAELQRVDKVHLLHYADNFEKQAEGHPEIKARLALRLAALLRALAAEQS